MSAWQIKRFGDRAIIVQFSGALDLLTNQKVHQLWSKVQALNWPQLYYGIPSNLDLTLVFKQSIHEKELTRQLEDLLREVIQHPIETIGKRIRIPVCYDPTLGLDLEELSSSLKRSPAELIQLHQAQLYQVFSMGFLPGFAYLGLLPDSLQVPRKAIPRSKVPKGSVAIAAQQTGIYPQDSPGGWQVIGQTPIPVFDPQLAHPFLLSPGDQVQFEAVDLLSFREIADQVAGGQFKWSKLYE